MNRFWAFAVIVATFLISTSSYAQSDVLERHLKSGGIAPLGGPLEILSMERTPAGKYVTDVSVNAGNIKVRIPLVLRTDDSKWFVDWTPDKAYLEALSNLAKTGSLPAGEGNSWVAESAIPAMPIVVTNKRFITPFGAVEPASEKELVPNESLMQHTQKWLNLVYGNDNAPAGFDIIAAANTRSLRLNEVLFSLGSKGLYLATLVGLSGTTATIAKLAVPVATVVSKEKPADVTVAVSRVEAGLGVRVLRGGALVDPKPDACDGMTFCATGAGDIELASYLRAEDRVVLGVSGSITASELFTIANALGRRGILTHISGAP